jgi:phospholipid transport system substrate-binding protein
MEHERIGSSEDMRLQTESARQHDTALQRVRRSASLIFAVLLCGVGTATTAAAPADTPEGAVRMLHEGLVAAAAPSSDADSIDERYRRIEPLIIATHDLPYIAELTIRRDWAELGPEQRRRFVAAFERFSVMTYASRFAGLREEMFSIDASAPLNAERAQVTATLTPPEGRQIPFEYVLQLGDDGWRIINILADNVSDLALKRAEYRRVLQSGSIDDLIAHIDEQTASAAASADL